MRTWVAALGLLLLLAALPGAQAHGEGIQHGAVYSGTLTPGQVEVTHLDFEDGPLIGGWVFLLVARVQGTAIEAEVSVEGTSAGAWTIPPPEMWYTTFLLPRDGTYNLTLRNPGAADATYYVYFDQSCNCVGKFVPREFPNGFVIFNVDTNGPTDLYAQFNEPKAMKVRVTAALLTPSSGGHWPDDFQTLAVSNAPRLVQTEGAPPVWLHVFNLDIAEAARVYFFVQGLGLNESAFPSPETLMITPYFDPRPASSGGFPVPAPVLLGGAAAAFGVVGAAFLWRGRRRRAEAAASVRSKKGGKGHPKTGGKGKGAVTRRGGGRGGARTRTSRGRSRRS